MKAQGLLEKAAPICGPPQIAGAARRETLPAEDETPPASSWQREVPPWLLSAMAHLALLGLLAVVSVKVANSRGPVVLDSRLTELPADREFAVVEDYQVGFSNAAFAEGAGAKSLAALSGPPTPTPDLREELPELPVERPVAVEPPQGWEIHPTLQIKGATGEQVADVVGAVDRLTVEILRSLEQRKTLVAWLFDASGSMEKDRQAVAKRFDKVYAELEASGKTADRALLSAVVSFGQQVQFLTEEPTDDLERIKEAVRSVVNDESGKEYVFTAVAQTAQRWLAYRRKAKRNFMIIVITDEVGDDENRLETTLDLTHRYGTPVYVVGITALFGREIAYLPWTDPNGGMHLIDVRQGPETLRPERIQLPFWAGVGRELEMLSSGFGPYALTRLCHETGGIYFVTPKGARSPFDPRDLKQYQPDYVSPREYEQLLGRNKACAALVKVAAQSRGNTEIPATLFAAADEAVFRRGLDEAQKFVALLEYQLQPMLTELEGTKADRDKLASPRWRASFDLAIGRVLAMWVRAREYNSVLAQMKQGRKFENPKNNHWQLKPADQITGGSRLEKMAEEAKTYLRRVTQEHAKTPWALLAEKELSQPFGWQLEELYIPLPAPGFAGAAPAPNPPPDPNRPKPIPYTVPKF